jgi:hypothetical protein
MRVLPIFRMEGIQIKVRLRLVVDDSNQPLLTCGRCSEVVVKASLTVYLFWFEKILCQRISFL